MEMSKRQLDIRVQSLGERFVFRMENWESIVQSCYLVMRLSEIDLKMSREREEKRGYFNIQRLGREEGLVKEFEKE